MRVIVLGGSGDVGRRAVTELAQSPDVSLVTVAGRNREKLEAVASPLGSRARVAVVDVNDPQTLLRTLMGHDVAAGAAGPFYRYELPIAQAAITAGIPYVSICDDYDAAQAVLQLDQEARARGVTVVTGAGWTPGLTNVMAKKGFSLLDSAEAIHVAWASSAADFEGFAVIPHVLHMFTGNVPSFSNGRWHPVTAGSGGQLVPFPEPLGPVMVYHVGHPEPVTLPRFLPGLREVTLKGGLTEGILVRLALLITRLGLTRTPAGKEGISHLFKPIPSLVRRWPGRARPVSGAWVEVVGRKGGRAARVVLTSLGRSVDITGIPLAVLTLMVGRGEIRRPGVMAPEAEGGPDPDRFFAELGRRGLTVQMGDPEYLQGTDD